MREITFIDLFAGGGGTSTGAFSVPGIKVVAAVNHDDTAIKTHEANHPETIHFREDLWEMDEKRLPKCNVMWASLECTDHSKAKGGRTKTIGSFASGTCLPRYASWCDPDIIWIENVPEFIKWGKLTDKGKRKKGSEGSEYRKWVQSIKDIGYIHYDRQFLNAADYGCPTRRIRYFGMFCKPGYNLSWPQPTHAEKENLYGLPTWKPCKNFLDLASEGKSIFDRTKPLCSNTLRRIAGGVRKFAPELYFIMKYYGNSTEGNNYNCQSIDEPMHTLRCKDSHCLVKIERMQFIQDHCHTDHYNSPEEPMKAVLTRETKQLITLEKQFIFNDNYNRDNVITDVEKPFPTIVSGGTKRLVSVKSQFLAKYYNGKRPDGREQHHCQDLEHPMPTIKTTESVALITSKSQFISAQYSSNGSPEANNHPITGPLPSCTTKEKFQFITTYFNAGGRPEYQNESINRPIGTILTEPNKKALVTADSTGLEFDIKMRFITHQEASAIMGFPEGYFTRPGLNLSNKKIFKMVGNSVPVGMAKALIMTVVSKYN